MVSPNRGESAYPYHADMGTDLSTAAIVASLAAQDDPTLKQRVERAVERMTKLEQTVAMIRSGDVPDVPLPEPDPATPVTAAVAADVPDGVDEIKSWADLKKSIAAVKDSKDPDTLKGYIKARAKQLHAENMLPDSWDD